MNIRVPASESQGPCDGALPLENALGVRRDPGSMLEWGEWRRRPWQQGSKGAAKWA
jgi:hypothetical protein